jgi:WD40 repeat protein
MSTELRRTRARRHARIDPAAGPPRRRPIPGPLRIVLALAPICVLAGALAPAATGDTSANAHFAPSGTVPLPGLGLSLAWSPAGDELAAGGHFREKETGRRYDTRTVDVRARRLTRAFECHYWWTIAHAWQANPYLGEVIADGGGDHAVKIWDAAAAGSPGRCRPGQFRREDGGLVTLPEINGWVTSLAFSPDGRHLAATSRDRTVRLWQIAPGPHQFRVVKLWYDKAAGNHLSVRWSPDGRRLAAGDRSGRVAEWAFDPVRDRWSDARIVEFARTGFEAHPKWFARNAAELLPAYLWIEGGHRQVWNVRYSPDGRRVASVGTDGVLSVHESGTGTVVYRRRAPRATPFHALDWSPDGALVAAGGDDAVVYVFDASDGSLHDRLVGHGNVVSAIAWSPDGRMLASTAGGQRVQLSHNQVVRGPDDAVHLWTRGAPARVGA